ncbi:molecular chaperone DjiA [Phaeovulum vinaykumarii]|nr:molecular chaperone DjiA [Phaeovulum vinaykumarii]
MSIWDRLSAALAALARGEGLSALFERRAPETSVAFTIAVIALGAKMAKADGLVTRDEVRAFRAIFTIPPEEEANAARVFDLARQDVAGFEVWAARIARMFGPGAPVLEDLIESLFAIAMADGHYHPGEDAFLAEVARIFSIPEDHFARLRARFAHPEHPDPYAVLGVAPGTPLTEIRAVWRAAVREAHPDRAVARGLPEEAVRLAEDRVKALNRAWEEIQTHHPQRQPAPAG